MFYVDRSCRQIISSARLGKLGISPWCPWILGCKKRNAGHSKWANIKHTKALKDSQRAATFAKLGRLMRVAIRDGGSHDPNFNVQLAQLMDQAKKSSMPSTTIQNIIKCAPSSKDASKPAVLEFRGPGGCIIIADILTDNFPKTRQSISTILRKNSAVYSEGGSRNLFDLKGVIEAVPDKTNSITCEEAIEHAIEVGAEEVIELLSEEGKTHFRFLCATELVHQVKTKLETRNYVIEVVDQEFIPHTLVKLNDSELESVTKLCDKLHENPDIVRLYDNIE